MNDLGRFYVDRIINNHALYYITMALGAFLFIFMLLSVELDNTQSAEVFVDEQGLYVVNAPEITSDTVYIYEDRNDAVYRAVLSETAKDGDRTYLTFEKGGFPDTLSNGISIEFVTGHESLLYRIFVRAGKSI